MLINLNVPYVQYNCNTHTVAGHNYNASKKWYYSQ